MWVTFNKLLLNYINRSPTFVAALFMDLELSYNCVCKEGFFGDGRTCDQMPQCCKTIHIDGSSQNYNQYDFVCSYSHDYHEYKAYTCKGDPTNNWAWWIDAREGGIGFYKLPHYGDRYLLGSPSLIPGEELRRVFNMMLLANQIKAHSLEIVNLF